MRFILAVNRSIIPECRGRCQTESLRERYPLPNCQKSRIIGNFDLTFLKTSFYTRFISRFLESRGSHLRRLASPPVSAASVKEDKGARRYGPRPPCSFSRSMDLGVKLNLGIRRDDAYQ